MDSLARINLTEEELTDLERLSSLGYSVEKMAMYFHQPVSLFKKEASFPAEDVNPIAYHIERGKLRSEALEELKILEAAERGNVTASQQLANLKRSKSWQLSREDLLAGPEPENFQSLQDYLQNPDNTSITKEEQVYLDALYVMVGLDRKYGKRNAIKFFTKQGIKLTRAREMYDEAISLYNIDNQIEKKAYRNKYADQVEEAARVVLMNMKDSKDAKVYGDLIKQAAELRELFKEDPPTLPPEVYIKPIRVMSVDPQTIELPEINRNVLATQIDELDVPEKEKRRLRSEAGLDTFNFIERLHELKEESQEG